MMGAGLERCGHQGEATHRLCAKRPQPRRTDTPNKGNGRGRGGTGKDKGKDMGNKKYKTNMGKRGYSRTAYNKTYLLLL